MKHYRAHPTHNLAAGVMLFVVAILIAACGMEAPPAPQRGEGDPVSIPTDPSPSATGGHGDALPTVALTPSAGGHGDAPPTVALEDARPTVTGGHGDAPPTVALKDAPPTVALTSTKFPIKTVTSTPSASPTPRQEAVIQATKVPKVKVYKTTVTLPTYPIKDYLVEQIDSRYNMPVFYFNRVAYEAAAPTPTPVDYTGVVLENPYLRLTFLPELGGRLYSAVVKATGEEIFYHNRVVKPSRYGVLEPVEANWWLATGGMEWAYPTQEHGYRWGVPWDYQVTQSPTAATITLSDTAPDRVGVEVKVTLPANRATFTVVPKLVNPGADTLPIQFWLNAALALSPDSMSLDTQFMVPAKKIVVHSRGEADWTVPEAQEEAPWPLVGETDLRDYRQWANYLGFFVPDMEAPFMGAYNPKTDLGVARLIEPGTVPGNKLFAFGSAFPDRSYTDDDSQYFEIWGGANSGFWPEDDVSLPGGGTLSWQEHWWPLAGLGGITWANQEVAIYLDRTGNRYRLSALVSRPRRGTLTVGPPGPPEGGGSGHGDAPPTLVLSGGGQGDVPPTPVLSEPFSADPGEPLQWDFVTVAEPVRVQFVDRDGTILLDYEQ